MEDKGRAEKLWRGNAQGSCERKQTPVPRAGEAGPAGRMERVETTRMKKNNFRILYFDFIHLPPDKMSVDLCTHMVLTERQALGGTEGTSDPVSCLEEHLLAGKRHACPECDSPWSEPSLAPSME